DIIASDHAPHLLSEKEGDALSAPSGRPGMQYQLPLRLDLYSPELVARLTAVNPAKIFKIDRRGVLKKGYFADLVRIKKQEHTISDSDVLSLCGWTPLAGVTVGHVVVSTWVNGVLSFDNGKVSEKISSKALKFNN
ncbi:MAG: amidohydrolase family protein, partial [Muribaculaceae bacterium]|nr:amidohydrolase family protein [Muribaculaceae bacterium]